MNTLLVKTAVAMLLGIILVVICYYLVDRPVAWFVHDHCSCLHGLLRWPPLISNWLKAYVPLAILLIVLWWAWKPGSRFQTVLLAISANLIVTTILKQLLKWGCGRYWPETWKHNNPSLIDSGDYGFHPFHYGVAYDSFPSGHAAVICSLLSILWLSYPRWRWLYTIIGGAMCVALVGMNYHFVGDVIAGVILGSTTGVYMTHLFHSYSPEPGQENNSHPAEEG
jgi:membrane-associated phospholipid phosphatase